MNSIPPEGAIEQNPPAVPERPIPLPVIPDNIPAELKGLPRWVCWRYTRKPGATKWTKPPLIARTGHHASTTDAETWCTFEEAIHTYQRGSFGFDGIGFVLSAGPDDPLDLAGLDLDKVGNPPESWAVDVAEAIATYAEWSPSGNGLRIFLRAHLPADARKKKGRAEAYQVGRYLTVTGHRLPDTPPDIKVTDDATLRKVLLVLGLLPEPEQPLQPLLLSNPNELPDSDLFARMFAAKNGPTISALWSGDTSAYQGNHSSADQALCNHLAFWTGRDAGRMDRFFRQSELMRSKWDERHSADGRSYGRLTIDNAIAGCRATYDPNRDGTCRGQGARVVSRGQANEGGGMPGPNSPEEPLGEPQVQNPAPLDCWTRSDDGNGRRLVERHGLDLRHFAGWKKWAVWDGGIWRMDDTEEVSRRAKDVMRAMYASATDAMRLLNQ